MASRRNFPAYRNQSSVFTTEEEQRSIHQNKNLEKELHDLNAKYDLEDKNNLKQIQKMEDIRAKEEYNLQL